MGSLQGRTLTSSADEPPFVPGVQLRIDGVPDVPQVLVEGIRRYTEFAATDVVDWHPTRRALLVAHRHGATTQLHLLDAPLGTARLLTDFPDPVSEATFEPTRGHYLVYARDAGGDEAAQLHRYDIVDGRSTRLTDPTMKHGAGVWNHAGDAIAFESLPLDRHRASNGDAEVSTRLTTLDPLNPECCRTIARLPGGGWDTLRWSADDRTLYALQHRSISDSSVWAIDVASGNRTPLLPGAADRTTVGYGAIDVSHDGRHLVYTSDEEGEFRGLTLLDLVTGERRHLARHIPWDVVAFALGGAGPTERVCAVVNIAGRHALRLFDLATGAEIELPTLPAAARSGSVSHVRFAPSGEIAFNVASAQSPGDVYTLDPRTGRTEQWTRVAVEGLDTSRWPEAEIIEWPSFDGLQISGLIHRPPARFGGKRPVLVHIHGGPESQATIGFLGVNNHFVDGLGIAYIQPNVRGSAGYGRTFLSLDDGVRREDAVRDIGALLDWIATQPDLDADRVLVAGRSYGGFMSLAVATTYASRIVASVAIVAISHFTSFLERTESYRRDLRRTEYGDERDPVIRDFFERISPLSNADRIARPLLVVAGRNDPRVPYREGEQIVARVRANDVPVWHVVADDEGHVFKRRPNIEYVFYAQVLFVQRYLLGST